MNVNEKGIIGLAKITLDLIEKGYEVYHPFSDYSPIDLIVADKNYVTKKLQIKYRKIEHNKIAIPKHSVVNGKKIPINLDIIDGWAIYNPESNSCYYVSKYDNIFTFRLDQDCSKMIKPNKLPLASNFTNPDVFWK